MVENSEVKLWGYKSAGPAQLRQLWKIQHVERDYYSIRSAYRHGLALRESGGDVLVAPLDTALAPKNTPLNFQWRIFRSGSSYVFQYVGTSSLTLRPADGATSPGADVTVTNVNPVDQFKWSLTWKTVQDQILLINTQNGLPATNAVREMELGNTATLASMNLMATYVSRSTNVQSFIWTSTDPSVATVNDTTGAVTAVGRGTTKIRATNSQSSNTVEFTVNVFETIYVKNFYDSTALYIQDSVPTAVAFLNKVYSEEFYLRFEMDTVNRFLSTSGVDMCPYGGTQACDQECLAENGYHHKDIYGISGYLHSTFFEKNHVVVMWSDCSENVYCEDRYYQISETEILQEHRSLSSALAAVVSMQSEEGVFPVPVVQVLSITQNSCLNYGDSAASKEKYISIILAHEIAHTLGLGETYDTSSYDDAPHESNGGELCIMKKFNNSTMESIYALEQPLCDECMNILRSEIVDDVYES